MKNSLITLAIVSFIIAGCGSEAGFETSASQATSDAMAQTSFESDPNLATGGNYDCECDAPQWLKDLAAVSSQGKAIRYIDGRFLAKYEDYCSSKVCSVLGCIYTVGSYDERHTFPYKYPCKMIELPGTPFDNF